ncbi:polysaccharide biosynthesis/export family protein [Riemerella columbipharyngis]|uniref:Polysaccharide export outer membrane protein n=1 Tax=Riemerella columbipharyngis TaxID=1071918 RepID=A0A1G6YX37_9FLAO|nr:polysaccharide biosynthesis/export family protein [Riemerella columbipharyngis]SDD94205.1 polysaccharide export outer membrane protein [Riemerella columbipharyngis]
MEIEKWIFAIASVFLLTSCKVNNDIAYMQNIEKLANDASVRMTQNTVQAGDELSILVSAEDMSVAAPFNRGMEPNNKTVSLSQGASNNTYGAQVPNNGYSYKVYEENYIDFPILGKIDTKEKTLEELKSDLQVRLKKYIINPSVSIKYNNYRVTVLGEVNKPGQYIIPDGKVRLLDVLGLAGDLTIYGKRDNILVVREHNGERENAYVNLTNADFINSPYYYLKQNDVVYVSPNKTRQTASMFGPQTGIYISIASVVVTILALVIRK